MSPRAGLAAPSFESLNLEIAPAPSPKLTFSTELSRQSSASNLSTSMNLDSPRSGRRGTMHAALRGSGGNNSPPMGSPIPFNLDGSPKLVRTGSTSSVTKPSLGEQLSVAKHLAFELRSLPALDPTATHLEVHVTLTSTQSPDIPLYEPFVTQVSADGRATCATGPRGLQTVFVDLPAALNDLLMVIRVLSLAPIPVDGKQSSLVGRRALAATAVSLATITPLRILGMDALEVAQLFAPSTEDKFAQLPEAVRKRSPDAVALNNKTVSFSVSGLPEPIPATAAHAYPAAIKSHRALSELNGTLPLQLTATRYDRNDFYVTLKDAQFQRPSKKTYPIEVQFKVDGAALTAPIRRGSGATLSKGEEAYSSFVLEASSNLVFEETACVAVPSAPRSTSSVPIPLSLTVILTKLSKKKKKRSEVGRGTLVLLDAVGTPLSNGIHSVPIQLSKKSSKKADRDCGSVRLKTQLVSNRLSTNPQLLRLRQWKSQRLDELQETLRQVRASGADVATVLTDSLDCLLGIVDSVDNLPIQTEAAHTILTLIEYIHGTSKPSSESAAPSEKMQALQRYCAAYPGMEHPSRLAQAMQRLLVNPHTQKTSDLLSVIHSLDMILRLLSKAAKAAAGERDLVAKSVLDIAKSLQVLFTNNNPESMGVQVTTARRLIPILEGFVEALPSVPAADAAACLLSAMKAVPQIVVVEKLNSLQTVLRAVPASLKPLFHESEARSRFWPALVSSISWHLGGDMAIDDDTRRICVETLHVLLEWAQKACGPLYRSSSAASEDVSIEAILKDDSSLPGDPQLLHPLLGDALPALVAALPPSSNSTTVFSSLPRLEQQAAEHRCNIAVALLAICYMTPARILVRYLFHNVDSAQRRATIITSLLRGLNLLMQGVSGTPFPTLEWDEMILFQVRQF